METSSRSSVSALRWCHNQSWMRLAIPRGLLAAAWDGRADLYSARSPAAFATADAQAASTLSPRNSSTLSPSTEKSSDFIPEIIPAPDRTPPKAFQGTAPRRWQTVFFPHPSPIQNPIPVGQTVNEDANRVRVYGCRGRENRS